MEIVFKCENPECTISGIQRENDLISKIAEQHFGPGRLRIYRPVFDNGLAIRCNLSITDYFDDVQKILSTDDARKDISKTDFVNEVIDNSEFAWSVRVKETEQQ